MKQQQFFIFHRFFILHPSFIHHFISAAGPAVPLWLHAILWRLKILIFSEFYESYYTIGIGVSDGEFFGVVEVDGASPNSLINSLAVSSSSAK